MEACKCSSYQSTAETEPASDSAIDKARVSCMKEILTLLACRDQINEELTLACAELLNIT